MMNESEWCGAETNGEYMMEVGQMDLSMDEVP